MCSNSIMSWGWFLSTVKAFNVLGKIFKAEWKPAFYYGFIIRWGGALEERKVFQSFHIFSLWSSVEYTFAASLVMYWFWLFTSLTSGQDIWYEDIHICAWWLFIVKAASLIMSIRAFGLMSFLIKYRINANWFSAFIHDSDNGSHCTYRGR